MPPYVFTTPVRFSDVDHAGIVYYPRFFHLFHLAFEELWRDRQGDGAYAQLIAQRRIGLPAVNATCDFRSPLRFGDVAEIELSVTRLGATSVTFRYRVFRAEANGQPRTLSAEGSTVCAVVDLARFVAIPHPDDVRRLLADLVDVSPA